MSTAPMVKALIKSAPNMAMMGTNLFWMYLTLGQRVRKARRAFEKQLVLEGMSKEDARRISECYSDLKNSINRMIFRGLTVNIGP